MCLFRNIGQYLKKRAAEIDFRTIRGDNKALEIARSVYQTLVVVHSRLVCEARLRHKEIDRLPGC